MASTVTGHSPRPGSSTSASSRAPITRAVKLFWWSHAVFSNLKSWLRSTFHGVSPKHPARYLDEFTYERRREGELFDLVVGRAIKGDPLPYHRLVAESVGEPQAGLRAECGDGRVKLRDGGWPRRAGCAP